MTSKEIVIRTLNYDQPERIAMNLPSPYLNDFYSYSYNLIGSETSKWHKIDKNTEERIDEWGNIWRRLDGRTKGEIHKGILDNLDMIEKIGLPDLDNYQNYKEAEGNFASNKDKFRIGSLPGFAFNITRKMRKLDQYLVDLLLNKDEIVILNEKINTLLEKAIWNYARAGADAIFFYEDWGTQENLMISPGLWREVFKPGFVRLCNTAHENKLKVFMHSCGKMTVIIPDLIECGIDVLQFDQPKVHGIDKLSEYSGKVTYWCPADIQSTLQSRDEKVIESDVKEMIEKLGCKGGGFIAGYYRDNEGIGLDAKWQNIACKAFIKYGQLSTRDIYKEW